jgi:peptidoglycan hydrolase CwlO-like protein
MKKENRKIHLDMTTAIKWVISIIAFFLLANFIFVFAVPVRSASSDEELKSKIENLRSQISKYQDEIDRKSQLEKTLAEKIEVLEADIKKIELQIQETNLVISGLDGEIYSKQTEIDEMEKKIVAKQEMLKKFLQELYERGGVSSTELVLGNKNFSDYFFQTESIESFEDQTKDIFDQLISLQDGLKREKEILVDKKTEKEDYRYIQMDQERSLGREREMKDLLATQTRSEKEVLQVETEKLQAELNAIQSLGEPIAIGEAVKAAKEASKLTNVAPEFLLGVLRVESGLGTNVGGGRYRTDMNPSQWETFKKICKEIGIDPDKTPVSRRACYNKDSKDGCGGWGGAMGPAQFMPSTWIGYKSKVEKTTGDSPANPWDIKDSLVAMGLKLAAVDGVTTGDRKAWAKAAGMYLAGGNWEKYPWYSDRVLHYADGFKDILKDY